MEALAPTPVLMCTRSHFPQPPPKIEETHLAGTMIRHKDILNYNIPQLTKSRGVNKYEISKSEALILAPVFM